MPLLCAAPSRRWPTATPKLSTRSWFRRAPAASRLRLISGAKRSACVWLRLGACVASFGVAMGHRREGAAHKRGKLMLDFLWKTKHTRSPRDRTHHSHARCARSHRPNASSGPRESCFGRFARPRLVSAQAQEVMRTKVSNVETSGSLRELSDQ